MGRPLDTRGGDAEATAPKRARHDRPTRQVQMLLPFATAERTREVLTLETGVSPSTDLPPGDPATTTLPFPTLPAREALADEDSDMDDVDDLPPADGDPLLNMDWWDSMPWDQILEHSAATMVHVPRALTLQTGLWRTRVSRHILDQTTPIDKSRGWKLFLALDLLLFGDIREEVGQHSKTHHIADRMEDMEAGRWGSVWNCIGYRQEADAPPQGHSNGHGSPSEKPPGSEGVLPSGQRGLGAERESHAAAGHTEVLVHSARSGTQSATATAPPPEQAR